MINRYAFVRRVFKARLVDAEAGNESSEAEDADYERRIAAGVEDILGRDPTAHRRWREIRTLIMIEQSYGR